MAWPDLQVFIAISLTKHTSINNGTGGEAKTIPLRFIA